MMAVSVKTVARAYFVLVLLLAVLVSPLPQLGIALVLLAVQLGSVYKSPKAGWDLALVVGSLIFAPLALAALAGGVYSILLIIPGVLLLDQSLKDNASAQFSVFTKAGRGVTTVSKALGSGLLLVFAASVIVWNITLMLTSAVLILYLSFSLAYVFRKVAKKPFEESKSWSRVVVGDTATDSTHLKAKSGISLFVSLSSSASWVHVEPSELVLPARGDADVNLRFTPPLAGPSKLEVQALAVDSRGLVLTAQVLEPIELHIIPRAKYAQWLANKYLEQTAPGTGPAASVPTVRATKVARRGVEYYGSRQYQPGDRWKDLDWKHTYLFGELVVKEFAGAQGQTAILVADLTAKDAEEADKLAYDFVMSALTLATESLPTALAAYNYAEVLAAMLPVNPRDALKKALELTGKITIVEPSEKVLQSAEMPRLSRSIAQLEQLKDGSAQKLIDVLKLEYKANREAAADHPVGQALAKIVERISPPATITVVSSLSSNQEELSITLDRLKEKGYNTVQVALKR